MNEERISVRDILSFYEKNAFGFITDINDVIIVLPNFQKIQRKICKENKLKEQ